MIVNVWIIWLWFTSNDEWLGMEATASDSGTNWITIRNVLENILENIKRPSSWTGLGFIWQCLLPKFSYASKCPTRCQGHCIHRMWPYTVRCRYNAVNFLKKYSQRTTHSSPVKARYGMSFVDPASDWYSSRVPAIIYAVSYYIGPHNNDTRLIPSHIHVELFTLNIKTLSYHNKAPVCTMFSNN